jgi:DMSO/TMAO reductase YedYZ molybdopterin-dependent catalytic subunit
MAVEAAETGSPPESRGRRLRDGLIAGLAAGVVLAVGTLIVRLVSGVPSFPEILQDQLLGVVPGSISGGVIDRVQFQSKPLLVAGIVVGQIAAGAAGGVLFALLRRKRSGRAPWLSGIDAGLLYWFGAELIVLPLFGAGPAGGSVAHGGASAGWSVVPDLCFGLTLAAIYAQLAPARTVAAETFAARRRTLALLGGLAVAVVGGIAIVRTLGGGAEHGTPAAADAGESSTPNPALPVDKFQAPAALSPQPTPVADFYVVSKNLSDPVVKAQGWQLEIVGMVNSPLKLSYDDIRALPTSDLTLTLECISNPVAGTLMSTGTFTGPTLASVLDRAGLQAGATGVSFTSTDGYTENLTLDQFRGQPTLLAHTLDGAPLPDEHGFPLRVIGPGRYGMKNPKWLTKIAATADPIGGYWERSGWQAGAGVQTTARFDTRPANVRSSQPLLLGGIAFAGDRGISRVEVSTDNGANWQPAALEAPLDSDTWVRWSYVWTPPSPARYQLVVRAIDGKGKAQEGLPNDSFPFGATGYHRLALRAS